MDNLIGRDVDRWPELVAEQGAHVHIYGKGEARPGRKMGHVTRVTSPSVATAVAGSSGREASVAAWRYGEPEADVTGFTRRDCPPSATVSARVVRRQRNS